MNTVNPCDPVDEREAAGFRFDEERVVREMREAIAYSATVGASPVRADHNAVHDRAGEVLKEFRTTSLIATALACDDILSANPGLKPEAVLKEVAYILVALTTIMVRAAKEIEGQPFEPARVALSCYEQATAVAKLKMLPADEALLCFRQPGSLRVQFDAQMKAKGFAPSDMPEPFPLTGWELKAISESPEALQALIDAHEWSLTEAESCGAIEWAAENELRRLQFQTLRDAAQQKREAGARI